jgi:hypothetical protein
VPVSLNIFFASKRSEAIASVSHFLAKISHAFFRFFSLPIFFFSLCFASVFFCSLRYFSFRFISLSHFSFRFIFRFRIFLSVSFRFHIFFLLCFASEFFVSLQNEEKKRPFCLFSLIFALFLLLCTFVSFCYFRFVSLHFLFVSHVKSTVSLQSETNPSRFDAGRISHRFA